MGALTEYTGTLRLTRLALRHDRVRLPLWLGGVVLTLAASAASVSRTYGTLAQQRAYTTIADTPVALLFNGPAPGADLGAIVMTETFMTVSVLTALMSAMAVVRHTRRAEETGRTELIGSAVVGRRAPLAAALTLTFGLNLVLAVLLTGALISNDLDVFGSVVAGLCFAAVGIVFASVAAVVAQLVETSRGANGLTAAVLGAMFILRALGDVLGHSRPDGSTESLWLSWVSPLGLSQQVRPYRDNAVWVLGLSLLWVIALVALAYFLTGQRDLGAGMLPERKGRPAAEPGLLSPIGLAWRLQRSMLVGWGVAMAIFGAMIGSLGDEVKKMFQENETFAQYLVQMGGVGQVTDVYFGAMMVMMGTIAAGYPLQALLRMRAEESSGRLEPLLATAVSRPRWMMSHIAIALFGVVALMVVTGVTAGVTYGLIAGDIVGRTVTLTGAALAQVPGPLVMAGFVVAVVALFSHWAVAMSWGVFAIWLVLGQLGAMLELPQTVLDLSPFSHLPAVPGADVKALPIVLLLLVAFGLTAAGMVVFRRRDLITVG